MGVKTEQQRKDNERQSFDIMGSEKAKAEVSALWNKKDEHRQNISIFHFLFTNTECQPHLQQSSTESYHQKNEIYPSFSF